MAKSAAAETHGIAAISALRCLLVFARPAVILLADLTAGEATFAAFLADPCLANGAARRRDANLTQSDAGAVLARSHFSAVCAEALVARFAVIDRPAPVAKERIASVTPGNVTGVVDTPLAEAVSACSTRA